MLVFLFVFVYIYVCYALYNTAIYVICQQFFCKNMYFYSFTTEKGPEIPKYSPLDFRPEPSSLGIRL